VSATLSTAAAARSVQMECMECSFRSWLASTFDFRACDVHRNVGARDEGPRGLDSLLSRDTATTILMGWHLPAHEDRPTRS
jgi:hypothetical protein